MKLKRMHQLLGIAMLIPLLLWSVTGCIFLTKPGYDGAYERLYPKLYPMNQTANMDMNAWTEVQLFRTILGNHVLAKKLGEWKHYNLANMQIWPAPSASDIQLLVNDAISENKQRYGEILTIEGETIYTDTGVTITLDWPTLSLRQKGQDTEIIDALYRIHYLQWLESTVWNKVLGYSGLLFLVLLSIVGLALFIMRKRS